MSTTTTVIHGQTATTETAESLLYSMVEAQIAHGQITWTVVTHGYAAGTNHHGDRVAVMDLDLLDPTDIVDITMWATGCVAASLPQ